MFRVLVVAPETVSEQIAGPNIRAVAMARQLARHFHTTLAIPNESDLFAGEAFQTRVASRQTIAPLLKDYSLVISQGGQYPARACLHRAGTRPVQVFDLYDPVLLELFAGGPRAAKAWTAAYLRRLTRLLLLRGDYLLCASRQQRDLWLGALYLSGRFEHASSGERLSPEDRIGIVPFGHDGAAPASTRQVLKGVHPGISANDKVLLWGGGVWNWLDPLTLIRAVAEIGRERGDVKLFFMGTRPGSTPKSHPPENFTLYEMCDNARALAQELGCLDRSVLFNEGWVPFAERGAYLLESDLAVCSAPESLENHFSFRTRLVDAVWAGLPIVCTRGGAMAGFVEEHDIGATVRGGDVKELKRAILATLEPARQAKCRTNMAACRDELRWDRCLEPLVEFCRRVERGGYQAPHEPFWRPWAQYLRYKAPTMIGKSLGA